VVGFGIHPDTHKPYDWNGGGEPGEVKREQLPDINEGEAQMLVDAAVELLIGFGYRRINKSNTATQQNPFASFWDFLPKNQKTQWQRLNDQALANLGAWVPEIFPTARLQATGAYRISSEDLDRANQEDLSIHPSGIKDWGEHDLGDPLAGKRTPIDIVMQYVFEVAIEDIAKREHSHEFQQAVDWLRERLDQSTKAQFNITAYDFPDERTIPQQDKLYGNHLERGMVSITAGAGASGKSSKAIAEALAMTTGKDLLGVQVDKPLRVLLINLEDDRNTMHRRIAAAMDFYKLKPEEVGGRLFVFSKGDIKLKIATQERSGVVQTHEDVLANLIKVLVENKIDVLSVDPLRKTHRVNEIDPIAMGEMLEGYERVAEEAQCAVHLWHHTRKGNGEEVSIDSMRGTSVLGDAPRSVEILETLSTEEAKKLGIAAERRRFYFRSFNGKLNFSPPIDRSQWFERCSVDLCNGPNGSVGDNVVVVSKWNEHTSSKARDLTDAQFYEIRQVIAQGGWRRNSQATRWVGKAIAQVMQLDSEEDTFTINYILKQMLIKQMLEIRWGQDERRKQVEFVVVAGSA
jgi:hypothetical protein